MYLRPAKTGFSVVFLHKQKQEHSSLGSQFIAHSDSYLSTVAAKMNYQLIVALLIVNVVVAKAYYGSRSQGYDHGRLLPGLGNALGTPHDGSRNAFDSPSHDLRRLKKRSTNLKVHPLRVAREAQRKVYF